MPRRLYDPLAPQEEDPLGPATPGMPKATAPNVARTTLLDGLAPASANKQPAYDGGPNVVPPAPANPPPGVWFDPPHRDPPVGPPRRLSDGDPIPPPAYDGGPETVPPSDPPRPPPAYDGGPDTVPPDPIGGRVTVPTEARTLLTDGLAPQGGAGVPPPPAPPVLAPGPGTPAAARTIEPAAAPIPGDGEPPPEVPPPPPVPPPPVEPPPPPPVAPPPVAPPPVAPPPTPQGRNDEAYIDSVIAGWMANNNPRGHKDPAYWKRRILETGGLGPDNLDYWLGRFKEAEGTHPADTPPAPPQGPGAPPVPGGSGQSGNVPESAFNRQLREFLMSQLGGLSTSIDENNPELQPAISAYRTQSQRDQQSERDLLAERAYATGELNTGGFDTRVQQGFENAAGKRANFAGSMVYQANVQRRQQLQAMLQTAVSMGLTEQQQLIQQKIASIDAELRRLSIDNQNSQFGDSLGLSYAQLIAQMNRDSLLGGLHG